MSAQTRDSTALVARIIARNLEVPTANEAAFFSFHARGPYRVAWDEAVWARLDACARERYMAAAAEAIQALHDPDTYRGYFLPIDIKEVPPPAPSGFIPFLRRVFGFGGE